MGKRRQVAKNGVRLGLQKGNHSMNPNREKDKNDTSKRDSSTIKRLLVYKNFKPIRNKDGKIVKTAPYQSYNAAGTMARVQPSRMWFGNTKTVTQSSLQKFQSELGKAIKDPYQVVLKQTKLPICLLNEKAKHAKVHMLDTQTFESTFGKKANRKRANVKCNDLSELMTQADAKNADYDCEKDSNLLCNKERELISQKEHVMRKGTSRRLWGELYKVVDSSDVIVQVLDARDPLGTRCPQIEKFLREEKPHKHVILVLNKCDLVPVWVTQRWVTILSAELPTLAFHASIKNPFGKGSLIDLLRQFTRLHTDKKQISVGFIGYPNVGKSSIINTLRSKKVCNVAPIAGETKVWQYITLMNKIYVIDCPGVVYPTGNTDTDLVLKGVVRIENIQDPEDYVTEVLKRVKREYMEKTYKISDWKDTEEFLEKLAIRFGKLKKGGEPMCGQVARMVLNHFQRGQLPYFVKPPTDEQLDDKAASAEKNSELDKCLTLQDIDRLLGDSNDIEKRPFEAEAPEIDLLKDLEEVENVEVINPFSLDKYESNVSADIAELTEQVASETVPEDEPEAKEEDESTAEESEPVIASSSRAKRQKAKQTEVPSASKSPKRTARKRTRASADTSEQPKRYSLRTRK
jgi:nuclear GTP-binding protein